MLHPPALGAGGESDPNEEAELHFAVEGLVPPADQTTLFRFLIRTGIRGQNLALTVFYVFARQRTLTYYWS